MDTTLDQLAALATGRLPAAEAAATRAAMERSPELRQAFERFAFVGATMTGDRRDPVPTSAIAAAKDLGRRLEALRQPTLLERLDASVRAVMARLAFDSRMDGPIVGLRGGTGFVLTYEVETGAGRVDLDLECLPLALTHGAADADTFEVVGQATLAGAAFGADTLEVHTVDETPTRPSSVSIDAHGMFRLRLAAGSYRLILRRSNADGEPIELPTLELP
jgi:hypothetical protein